MAWFFAPWIVYALVLVLHVVLPARRVEGYVKEDGRPLRYRLNGLLVLVVTIVVWTGVCRAGWTTWDALWLHRYVGAAVKLADRLFLVDHETLNGHEITQTILFPSFQSQVTRLTGLKMGVADNSERMPCCVRVVYQRLDEQVSLREALAKCGLLAMDDPSLDASLLDAVNNDVQSGDYHFRARH